MIWSDINKKIKSCTSCELYKTKREYVPGILGSKYPRIIFLGEAPGRMEDINGEPFCGQSGTLLMHAIEQVFNMSRGEYTILNTLKCRPIDNAEPTKKQKGACISHLVEQIKFLAPCIIITLGRHAGNFLLEQPLTMGELVESYFVDTKSGISIIPCYHPAYYLRKRRELQLFIKSLESVKDGSYTKRPNCVRFDVLSILSKNSYRCSDILSSYFDEV